MTDKVTPLFGITSNEAPAPQGPQPREYEFHFKEGGKVVPAYGYPAFNGQLYAVLDEPDEALTINFICSASDVLYVADSERAEDDLDA